MAQPKVIFMDIEASGLVASFGHMISFGWMLLGEEKPHCVSFVTYPKAFKKDVTDDKWVVNKAIEVLSEADVWVTWYGTYFDVPYIQTRALLHKLPLLPPTAHVDLWKVARNRMKMHSNRLEAVSQFLGVNSKTHLDGPTWQRAAAGHKKSISYVVNHNIEDILTLKRAYDKMRPLIHDHPNMCLITGETKACPTCGGKKFEKRGFRYARTRRTQRIRCLADGCGKWSTGKSEPVKGVDIR